MWFGAAGAQEADEAPAAGAARAELAVPSTLVGRPEARRELKLTPEQSEKIDAVRAELQEYFRDLRKKVSGMARSRIESTRPERRKEMAEKRKAASERIMAALDKVQAARLRQMQLQVRGVHALEDDDVAKELELTEDQRKSLDALAAKVAEDGPAGEGAGARVREWRVEAMKILTQEQRKKYNELLGEPVEIEVEREEFGRRIKK